MSELKPVLTVSLLSEDRAAEILGVSVSFLQNDRVTRRHGVPYLKVGGVFATARATYWRGSNPARSMVVPMRRGGSK